MTDKKYSYEKDWDCIYNNPNEKPWEKSKIDPFLESFFEKNKIRLKNHRILDIGCGNGKLCEWLVDHGYENVTGIDVSETAIKKCRQGQVKDERYAKITYSQANILSLENWDDCVKGEYDILVCWFLLHHIKKDDVTKFVSNLYKLCRVGGILVISFLSSEHDEVQRKSLFSDEHGVLYYDSSTVKKLFKPYFNISDGNKKQNQLLEHPDNHNLEYKYQVLEMTKTLKELLGIKVQNFKKKYVFENNNDDISTEIDFSPLVALLHSYSHDTKQFVDTIEPLEFDELFKSLFRNVSRFICKQILKAGGVENNVIILKMDVHSDLKLYSATNYASEKGVTRPHCKFNDEKSKFVTSRAYELFYRYKAFVDESSLSKLEKYSLHSHFVDNPSLSYISFYNNNNHVLSHPGKVEYKNHSDYCDFLDSIFGVGIVCSEKGHTFVGDTSITKEQAKQSYNNLIRKTGISTDTKIVSFSCFNLGIKGFESWGSLMIESSNTNYDEIIKLFYDNNNETKLLNEIKNIVFILKKIDYEYYEAASNKKIKKESIKSAVSAIMSRNLSHNLGSHYLYYTKKHLAELADSFDEKGPDIRGAAQVLGYIQARMDYLATIVAGEKYPYGSVYFKGQIFDELTIDDFSARHFKGIDNTTNKDRKYKRTTNYLLQNLILSENFTRNPVFPQSPIVETGETEVKQQIGLQSLRTQAKHFFGKISKNKQDLIELSLKPKEDGLLSSEKKDNNKLIKLKVLWNGDPFTGAYDKETEEKEKATKLELSKLCVALPGGIMSVHAFFNVIENIIRNSAKYLKEDFKNIDDLVVTIDIKESVETIWNGNDIPSYTFTIFDNKENALNKINRKSVDNEQSSSQTLLEMMNDKLCNLSILTTENELEKSDKGLKEILFSTLWMRAYTYEKSKKMSDVLFEIESKTGNEKLMEIKDHAFEYVAVDEKGQEISEEQGNLGIRFSLPQYRMMKAVDSSELSDDENLKKIALNSFTDIICIQQNPTNDLKHIFTRIYYDEEKKVSKKTENNPDIAVEALKKVLRGRFGDDFDSYKLFIGGWSEEKDCYDRKKYGICFITHLESQTEQKYKQNIATYCYCESISGGNFTKTIETIFLNGTKTNGKYKKPENEYFGLKVKEAALTRITLIDERFYKNMNKSSLEQDLMSAKNVRLLNLKPKDSDSVRNNPTDVLEIFDGNSFDDSSENKDHTHFLSIHLGMIEKIVDDEVYSTALKLDEEDVENDIPDIKGKRAIALMKKLKKMFNAEFVTVHSGRGNFSKDLEGPLREYQFISVSALESVLTNSKFLLAQLFYNTVYIGKGVANE